MLPIKFIKNTNIDLGSCLIAPLSYLFPFLFITKFFKNSPYVVLHYKNGKIVCGWKIFVSLIAIITKELFSGFNLLFILIYTIMVILEMFTIGCVILAANGYEFNIISKKSPTSTSGGMNCVFSPYEER